jgi:phage tail sheath protein FI
VAEILSPGVFIEEVPSQVQVIQAVSTSNMGAVGFTQRGPENTATLVTSFEGFTRQFGPVIAESFMPLSMAAFYSNGGRRAFVVRVVPSDAVLADADMDSQQTDQEIEAGDGATLAFAKTDITTSLNVNSGASPIVAGSFTIRWREAGTPVATEAFKDRADTGAVVMATGVAFYEGRVDPASLVTYDPEQFLIVPGTFILNADPDGVGDVALAVTATTDVATADNFTLDTDGFQVTVDHRSGFFTVEFRGTSVPDGSAAAFTVDYTPATVDKSVTDDGAGALPVGAGPELSGAGSISYLDGAYDFDTVAAPHDEAPVLATYSINAWDLNPISKGTWGNDMRTTVEGDLDFFDAASATYSRFKFNVLLLNSATLNYDIIETYEQLSFSDTTDAQYFPDVVNELSDLVSVTEPGGDEAPNQLSGISRSEVLGGGDEDAANRTVATTLSGVPLASRTLIISYTDTTGAAKTITDDGSGALIGSVDAAGTNTINYLTGAIDVLLLDAQDAGTLITVAYTQKATETLHSEDFAGGTNGTFSPSTYGRNQISSPTLAVSGGGIFALNRIEELMQIIVPDFVGDLTITGDLLDYVDGRGQQPSGGDRFVILQPPVGSDAQEAVDWFRLDLGRFSKYAALYWPHVKVADPLADNRPLTMPVIGHIAGIYARTDVNKNVGKAPGGTVDGALRFLTGLELEPTQGERDFVYPNKINPLISSPQTGLAVWGVRTIASESEWRYINVRRLFMFLEKSVFNATHWIVFENNGPVLWAKIKAQLTGFLTNLFNEGLFAGSSPSDAFFVIVDESNNDANSIAAGQVIIDIGVAAQTPAEFVRFRFQQLTLG